MTLNEFAAQNRRDLFDDLKAGREPRVGTFSATQLAEARTKGVPQVGTTRYTPTSFFFEFVYPAVSGATMIVTVEVPSPERIVFLPVPEWVIESIWQGDIDGSYHFESHAVALLNQFRAGLEPDANAPWFGPRAAKRRE